VETNVPHLIPSGLPEECRAAGFEVVKVRIVILKILAVDDEPQVLEIVKAMVEPLGMIVETSTDSQAVASRVNTESYDGFLLDARMPVVDGFMLAECIRKSPVNSGVPIAMLTGYDDVETMRKGFRAGVTFFLGKPFTRERAAGLFSAMRGMILREKRQSARLPFRTSVHCRWGQAGEHSFRAESLNMGERGMLLEPSGGITLGQEVRLEFRLPNRKALMSPQARVVRKDPPDRFAVQFLEIGAGEQESIRDYIFGRPDD
jgi:CheY-like chemotaxis protein